MLNFLLHFLLLVCVEFRLFEPDQHCPSVSLLCLSLFRSLALPVPSCICECDGVSSLSGQLCLLNHSTNTFTDIHVTSYLLWQEPNKTKLDLDCSLYTNIQTLQHAANIVRGCPLLWHGWMVLCMSRGQKGWQNTPPAQQHRMHECTHTHVHTH